MAKIRGWEKRFELKDQIMYVRDDSREKIMIADGRKKKWGVVIRTTVGNKNLYHMKEYDRKKEAKDYAIGYMKKNPRGS